MTCKGFSDISAHRRVVARSIAVVAAIVFCIVLTASGCGDAPPQPGPGVRTGDSLAGDSGKAASTPASGSAATPAAVAVGTGTPDENGSAAAPASSSVSDGAAGAGAGDTAQVGDRTGIEPVSAATATEGETAQSSQVIRMARIPFRNARELVITHEPMMKYLAARLGVGEVKLVSAPDYRGIVDLLKSGKAEMAWMGTFNYIDAYAEVGVETLVRPKRFGKSTYGGLIIAHVDSGINTLADLKGKSFAFVDKKSASGYLFPFAALIENGVNPNSDFSNIQYLKQHDSVCMAVLYRKVDAGAVYDDARKKLKSEEQAAKLKVIKSISEIPNEPIVVTKTISPEIKKALKEAFISLSTENPEGAEVLDTFNKVCADSIEGFEVSADSDYDYVRQIDKILKQHLKDDEENSSAEGAGKSGN